MAAGRAGVAALVAAHLRSRLRNGSVMCVRDPWTPNRPRGVEVGIGATGARDRLTDLRKTATSGTSMRNRQALHPHVNATLRLGQGNLCRKCNAVADGWDGIDDGAVGAGLYCAPMLTDLCCPVLELRQYTLHPGQRDVLIRLFDREFVETQEAVGMRVVGQFRDMDDPDRFVWVRGFRDMAARAEALAAFYGGPVWARHRDAANATMIDSDDVLLLRPVDDRSGFPLPGVANPGAAAELDRPPVHATAAPTSLVAATVYDMDGPVDDEFVRFFDQSVRPVMVDTGAAPLACLQTETSQNTFPALPVRTGENVFVWFSRFTSLDQYRDHLARLAQSTEWTEAVLPELSKYLTARPTRLRLAPTARSLLR